MENNFIAIAISKTGVWVCLSKPCNKKDAEFFRGKQLENETFDIKTVSEVDNYKNVLR